MTTLISGMVTNHIRLTAGLQSAWASMEAVRSRRAGAASRRAARSRCGSSASAAWMMSSLTRCHLVTASVPASDRSRLTVRRSPALSAPGVRVTYPADCSPPSSLARPDAGMLGDAGKQLELGHGQLEGGIGGARGPAHGPAQPGHEAGQLGADRLLAYLFLGYAALSGLHLTGRLPWAERLAPSLLPG